MSEELERFVENRAAIVFQPLREMADEIARLRAQVKSLTEENVDLRFGFAMFRESVEREHAMRECKDGQLPPGQG